MEKMLNHLPQDQTAQWRQDLNQGSLAPESVFLTSAPLPGQVMQVPSTWCGNVHARQVEAPMTGSTALLQEDGTVFSWAFHNNGN